MGRAHASNPSTRHRQGAHAREGIDRGSGTARAQPAWVAPPRGRVCGGRRIGAGHGAVLRLAGAVDHATDAGMADRRGVMRRRPTLRALVSAPRGRRRRDRLVVRVRLFRAWPVLDRRGIPGRGRDVRGAAAVRGHPAPCRSCPVLRRGRGDRRAPAHPWRTPRTGAGADVVGGGVATRPYPERLSLEHAGLRADLPAPPDAERRRARHLRPHAHGCPGLCPAAGAVE